MKIRPLATPLMLAFFISACVPQPDPLIGAWRSSIQLDRGAFAAVHDPEFMYSFNAGGTMTESSNYDAAPPVPPAYGTWRKTGPQSYEVTCEFFSTAPAEAPGDADRILTGHAVGVA